MRSRAVAKKVCVVRNEVASSSEKRFCGNNEVASSSEKSLCSKNEVASSNEKSLCSKNEVASSRRGTGMVLACFRSGTGTGMELSWNCRGTVVELSSSLAARSHSNFSWRSSWRSQSQLCYTATALPRNPVLYVGRFGSRQRSFALAIVA